MKPINLLSPLSIAEQRALRRWYQSTCTLIALCGLSMLIIHSYQGYQWYQTQKALNQTCTAINNQHECASTATELLQEKTILEKRLAYLKTPIVPHWVYQKELLFHVHQVLSELQIALESYHMHDTTTTLVVAITNPAHAQLLMKKIGTHHACGSCTLQRLEAQPHGYRAVLTLSVAPAPSVR